jgi:hypothetical protein
MSGTATLDPVNQQRLQRLARMLRTWRSCVRYVDYRQAERDVERLAALVLERFSPDEIAEASFRAIPRGGLIVLGMLSYALGLKPKQLAPRTDGNGLEFLVDDCSLTGVRFRQALPSDPRCKVVFLHLYSHPGLRHAIVEREPRVLDCIAAHDLRDLAEESFRSPAERASWREAWSRRLPIATYWIGQPEPICFAWTEPDRPFWNSENEQVEDGWTFIPPHLCLKNRFDQAPAVKRCRAEWQSPDNLAYGTFDGKLWLVNLTDERVVALEGVGADLWRWWAALGTREAVAAQLATSYQLEPDRASAEAEAFAAVLAESGLLELALD